MLAVPSRRPSAIRLLEQIVALEKQSADRMTARRNEVAAQLRHVYAAGQARDAYAANRPRRKRQMKSKTKNYDEPPRLSLVTAEMIDADSAA